MTTRTASHSVAPGLVQGRWVIDPIHSDVSFTVRHLMVSKVTGHFARFEGAIDVSDDALASSVEVTIDASSIDTREANRDADLKGPNYLNVEGFPQVTYRSTSVRQDGDKFVVDGALTIRGVTREVPLELEFHGVGADPWGGTRAGFSATAEINRHDFGISFDIPLDGGGLVVGEKIRINLEVEAVLER